MALQGTLDTFALPDVLRLLASTKKSGRLRITGDRGHGSVWVDTGQVVGAEAAAVPKGCPPVDVVFDLLRYHQGSFTFEVGSMPTEPLKPIEVDNVLAEAEHLLAEWHAIQAVVPSMEAWVSLVPDLPESEVVIDSPRWHTIVAVGAGTTITRLGAALELSDVTACREAKDLVELGLATITEPEPQAAAVVMDASVPAEAAPDLGSIFNSEPRPEPAPMASAMPGPVATPDIEHEPVDEMDFEADEVSRQLASLSPKAARAVAAAAEAATDEDRDAALAEVGDEDDDEPINRGLLLKFLSSVKT